MGCRLSEKGKSKIVLIRAKTGTSYHVQISQNFGIFSQAAGIKLIKI